MTSAMPEPLDRPRVLLVEDDPAVRRALQLLLQSQGYDVRAYRTGKDLCRDPEAMLSACLIADLMIPDVDALGLLGELRGAGWTGPAILISGHLTDEWAVRALKGGYSAVLAKPIAHRELVRRIAHLVPPERRPKEQAEA